MNDWYNDPPELPEPPDCCGEMMVDFPDGVCLCGVCGLVVTAYTDYPDDFDPGAPETHAPRCVHCGEENSSGCQLCDDCAHVPCRHGNQPGECDACDHEGDIAYDAAREGRFR